MVVTFKPEVKKPKPKVKITEHIYSPDYQERVESKFNTEIVKHVDGKVYHERIKSSKVGRNRTTEQLVGMMLHMKLWFQSNGYPYPGDYVIFHGKKESKYILNRDRHIEEVSL
jgi:hypothetical protein